MGFFDKLTEAAKAVKKISDAVSAAAEAVNKISPAEDAAARRSGSAEEEINTSGKTPAEIIASGSQPFKDSFTVSDEYGDKKYSFDLPRDFVEFNSHCEADPSYQYEPYFEPENDFYFTEYSYLPTISIQPNDNIYYAIESGKAVNGMKLTKCSSSYFAFSAEFAEKGVIYYAYGFKEGTAREMEMLCVEYNPDIKGTELEKKLKRALDNAAASYKEENI